jgi:hypothetical protein
MNLQTVKARAIPLDRPNGKQVWRVTHPHTSVAVEALCPFNAAEHLLRHHVLPRQVEMMKEPPC